MEETPSPTSVVQEKMEAITDNEMTKTDATEIPLTPDSRVSTDDAPHLVTPTQSPLEQQTRKSSVKMVQHTDVHSQAMGRKAELEELRQKQLAKKLGKELSQTGTEAITFSTSEMTDFFLRQKELDKEWRKKQSDSLEYLHRYRNRANDSPKKDASDKSPTVKVSSAYTTMSEFDAFFLQQKAAEKERREKLKDSMNQLHQYKDSAFEEQQLEAMQNNSGPVLVSPGGSNEAGCSAVLPSDYSDANINTMDDLQEYRQKRLAEAMLCPLPESPPPESPTLSVGKFHPTSKPEQVPAPPIFDETQKSATAAACSSIPPASPLAKAEETPPPPPAPTTNESQYQGYEVSLPVVDSPDVVTLSDSHTMKSTDNDADKSIGVDETPISPRRAVEPTVVVNQLDDGEEEATNIKGAEQDAKDAAVVVPQDGFNEAQEKSKGDNDEEHQQCKEGENVSQEPNNKEPPVVVEEQHTVEDEDYVSKEPSGDCSPAVEASHKELDVSSSDDAMEEQQAAETLKEGGVSDDDATEEPQMEAETPQEEGGVSNDATKEPMVAETPRQGEVPLEDADPASLHDYIDTLLAESLEEAKEEDYLMEEPADAVVEIGDNVADLAKDEEAKQQNDKAAEIISESTLNDESPPGNEVVDAEVIEKDHSVLPNGIAEAGAAELESEVVASSEVVLTFEREVSPEGGSGDPVATVEVAGNEEKDNTNMAAVVEAEDTNVTLKGETEEDVRMAVVAVAEDTDVTLKEDTEEDLNSALVAMQGEEHDKADAAGGEASPRLAESQVKVEQTVTKDESPSDEVEQSTKETDKPATISSESKPRQRKAMTKTAGLKKAVVATSTRKPKPSPKKKAEPKTPARTTARRTQASGKQTASTRSPPTAGAGASASTPVARKTALKFAANTTPKGRSKASPGDSVTSPEQRRIPLRRRPDSPKVKFPYSPKKKTTKLYNKPPSSEPMSQVCTSKWIPNAHGSRGGCERCLHFASQEEKDKFQSMGHHYRVNMVCGGCVRACSYFPRKENEPPVRLCPKCFYDTHAGSRRDPPRCMTSPR